jgi:hypothetical protein
VDGEHDREEYKKCQRVECHQAGAGLQKLWSILGHSPPAKQPFE